MTKAGAHRPVIPTKHGPRCARRGHALALAAMLAVLAPVCTTSAAIAAEDGARPYDGKLQRLAEILGAIHYLRELCGADEGQLWRKRMQELIRAEGTTSLRRVRLIQNFNKGYRSYRRTYRLCTQSARTVIAHFLDEGAKITDTLLAEQEAKTRDHGAPHPPRERHPR